MTIEQVIEKIQKLLALSKSDNPHEAALAAAKAQEIMFEYHLGYQEVGESSTKRPKDDIDFQLFYHASSDKQRSEIWRQVLINSISQTNFAKVIMTADKMAFVIIAREVDIEHVKYLYVYLTETIERICRNTRLEEGMHIPLAMWEKSFCIGAVDAIHQSLYEQKAADEAKVGGQALVLRSNTAVSDKFNELYPKTHKTPRRVMALDRQANNAGYREGKKVGIHRALDPKRREQLA